MTVKMSSKGWVVIPAPLRQKYNLKAGSNLDIIDYGGVLALIPACANPIAEAAGMLKGKSSLTKALLEEHHKELENER